MGLDMYLEKEIYIWDRDRDNVVISGINVDTKRVKKIVEEVGYWRKANAIHQWFVDNVQNGQDDCRRAYVIKSDMQVLLATVEGVLQDHSRAEELLPTQSGFFFGSTDYDEYYFRDLEETKKILESALKEVDGDGEFYYHSSW